MWCTGGGVFGVYSGGYSGVFRGVFGGYSGGIRGYSGPTAPLRDTVFTGCGLVRGGVFGASGPTLYNTRGGGGGGGPGGGNPGPTRNSRILTAQKFPNANASRTSTAPKRRNTNASTNRPGLNQTGAKFSLRSAGAAGAQGLQLRSVAAANSQGSRGDCDPSVR